MKTLIVVIIIIIITSIGTGVQEQISMHNIHQNSQESLSPE